MKKKIAIICFGFQARSVRSQPWHMADGMATALLGQGLSVEMLTDVEAVPCRDYKIHTLPALFHRYAPRKELVERLKCFNPDTTFVFVGSHELLTPKRFHLPGSVQLVLCNARFTFSELLRVSFHGYWKERSLLLRPALSSLIPGWILRRGYRNSKAAGVVYVSSEAQSRYKRLGLPKGVLCLPAVDKKYWRKSSESNWEREPSVRTVCYFGPPLQLRGIDLTISAFEEVAGSDNSLRLQLLLRLNGEAYVTNRFEYVLRCANASRYADRIDVVSNYLTSTEIKDELDRASVFLLPFKLTVSDSPLVVIEAGLTGKPVVALTTPGVEEFVEAFDGVCTSDAAGLGKAILKALAKSPREIDGEQWVDWSYRIKPIMDGAIHA